MTQPVMSIPSQRLLFLNASKRLYCQSDADLKSILAAKIAEKRERVKLFRQKHAAHKVSDVTVNSLYGGMRDVQSVVCETSMVDPEGGVRFRGLSIPEIRKALPKAGKGAEPLPEGMLWLLLTGDVPSDEQVYDTQNSLGECPNPDHQIEFRFGHYQDNWRTVERHLAIYKSSSRLSHLSSIL